MARTTKQQREYERERKRNLREVYQREGVVKFEVMVREKDLPKVRRLVAPYRLNNQRRK